MRNSIITAFEQKILKSTKKLPDFRAGDTVNVHYRITEASKSRIQQFEGIVLRRKRGTMDATFTVRKISAGGIGVERVFPSTSPNVEKVEVRARGKVRRSRLYYLRDLAGKAARIQSRYEGDMTSSSGDKTEESAPKAPKKTKVTEAPSA